MMNKEAPKLNSCCKIETKSRSRNSSSSSSQQQQIRPYIIHAYKKMGFEPKIDTRLFLPKIVTQIETFEDHRKTSIVDPKAHLQNN
jgi:hypothetical protein